MNFEKNDYKEGGKLSIKVFLSISHPLIRIGIQTILSTVDGFQLIDGAVNEDEILKIYSEFQPDVIIMHTDELGTSTFEELIKLKDNYAGVKIIMIYDSRIAIDALLVRCKNLDGIILQDEAPNKIIEAIQTVVKDGRWISSGLCGVESPFSPVNFLNEELTKREFEVLQLVGAGKSNFEIGSEMGISVRTVRKHLENIYQKMGVDNRMQAVLTAQKLRWLNNQ